MIETINEIMKTIGNRILITFVLVVVFCSMTSGVQGQETKQYTNKTICSVGFGILEVVNAAVGFTSNNSQLSFRLGIMPVSTSVFAVSGDYYYHFGGFSEKAGMNTWFGRFGLLYYSETGETFYDKLLYFNPRIGRKVFFNEKLGFEFDAGLMLALSQSKYRQSTPLIDFDMTLFPGMSVSLFYRF